ncbi:hypothetical protein SLA2020_049410 [Shorea laevis]
MEIGELRTLFSRVDVFQNKLRNFIKVRVPSFCGANIDIPVDSQHLKDASSSDIPSDIRHLNLISEEGMPKMEIGELRIVFSRVDVFQNKLRNFIKVRVLSFCGANIHELPAFLGKMKHLRFLDVSQTGIKELPKFITKLYHLQTFRFLDCWRIKRPLEGIWELVNLRHIYFNQQPLMPARIGRLTYLRTLQLFAVGQQKGRQIEELGCLSQLSGKLEICNLDMVRHKKEVMGAGLSKKVTIQELQLVFGKKRTIQDWQSLLSEEFSGSENRCKHDEDILEGLQPHSNFKGLTIERYYGKSCPAWMLEMENFPKNLMLMTFSGCPWLESIPSLLLSEEAKVEINYCKNLKSIADSSLQKLIIMECEKLVGVEVGQVAMKSLKEVHIIYCGKLENLLKISKLQSFEVLELWQCTELKMIGDDAPFTSTCLQQLNIQNCDRLMSMPNVDGLSSLKKIEISWCGQSKSIGEGLSTTTCLKELIIMWCYGLMSFPNPHGLLSLQKIQISRCGQLKSIGKDLSTATCLKELTIMECSGLMSFPNLHGLSSLQILWIEECGGLRSLPSGWPSCNALEVLVIANCNNLISIPNDLKNIPNPACLAHLKKLIIGGFSIELKEFSDLGFIGSHLEGLILIARGEPREPLLDQIHHLTALRFLQIRDFDGLEALPNWFGNLSSLQALEISNCKSLKHMEAIRYLSELKGLSIDECPELKERCTRGSGSEWDYISHIPHINIEDRWIQGAGAPVEVSSAFNYIQ